MIRIILLGEKNRIHPIIAKPLKGVHNQLPPLTVIQSGVYLYQVRFEPMILPIIASVFHETAARAEFLTGQERACINCQWKIVMTKIIPVSEGNHIKNSSEVVTNPP